MRVRIFTKTKVMESKSFHQMDGASFGIIPFNSRSTPERGISFPSLLSHHHSMNFKGALSH